VAITVFGVSNRGRTTMSGEQLERAVSAVFTSPNECDRNGEVANVVDGLFVSCEAFQEPPSGDIQPRGRGRPPKVEPPPKGKRRRRRE
jgi:hypothetical protein